MKNKIRKIATDIRKQLSSISSKLLHGTHPHLGGLCGYGSLMLHKSLKENGFKPQIVSGNGHWYVKCGEFLVDVTATQFGQPKVVVRNFVQTQENIERREFQMEYWRAGTIHDNACDAGLCNLRRAIRDALDSPKKSCTKCNDEE